MDVKKTKEYQYMPFIVKEHEDLQGGLSVSLADLRKDVDSVPPGAYIGRDESGLGHIVKTAELAEQATDAVKSYKVKKNHQLVVGEPVTSKDAQSVKAFKITKIDTSNADFDTLTVGTTLGVQLEAGNHLIVVKAEDSTGGESVLPHPVVGVTKREIDTTGSHAMVGVLTKGTVNVANMAFGAPKYLRDMLIHITYQD